MKKLFEMHVKATSFFGTEDRTPETERVVRELFYLPEQGELDDFTVGMSLRLEDFLWHLYTTVPQPASPLKLAAHKKRLDTVAEILNNSLDSDQFPALTPSDLDMVRSLIEDETAFGKINIPFNANPHRQLQEGETIKAVPLPAVNVLRDLDFVTTLDELFNVG